MIVKTALTLMVLFGLWGAGNLSYDQFRSGEACPILGDMVPACYIAFAGYVLITTGVIASLAGVNQIGAYLFWGGIVIAGGLAALASILELVKGDVCPVAFGSVPMCYVSLLFTAVIVALYMKQATVISHP